MCIIQIWIQLFVSKHHNALKKTNNNQKKLAVEQPIFNYLKRMKQIGFIDDNHVYLNTVY